MTHPLAVEAIMTDLPSSPRAILATLRERVESAHVMLATAVSKADVLPLLTQLDAALLAQEARLTAEAEIALMQQVACMTASVQNTETSARDRIGRDHPYWSVAYRDVCRAVDREMALWEDKQRLEAENAALKADKAGLEQLVDRYEAVNNRSVRRETFDLVQEDWRRSQAELAAKTAECEALKGNRRIV